MKVAREIYGYILGAVIFLGFIGVIGWAIIKPIPTGNKDIVISLLSTYGVIVVLVAKHFYDGNKQSASRDEMLYKSNPPAGNK